MNYSGIWQLVIYMVLLLSFGILLGNYMAAVYEGRFPRSFGVLAKVEALFYKLCGIDANEEMTWQKYAIAMLWFNVLGFFAVYLIQRFQAVLPLNPEALGAVSPELAFNTAVSFATNTNWQSYGGETTMSYLTQMLALTVQNFLSAAAGMACLVALIRGFSRHVQKTIGNFWVDLTRSVIYILLPLSLVLAIALVGQGAPQTFNPYQAYKPIEAVVDANGKPQDLKIALGPVASQLAIKQLGTNGGGYFNVNSAHPFENPTPLSNFLEVLAILIIPVGLCQTFGKMVGNVRQGLALLAAMTVMFVASLWGCYYFEASPLPPMSACSVNLPSGELPANMEGKEQRFGIANSALWATATTAASNGSVNSMHDSFSPMGGLFPMLLMQLGEVVYGGVGSGLYGMVVFAIITVFIAGLMVGRTPEYLGKKIESFEIKMCSLVILFPPLVVLLGAAVAASIPEGQSSVCNTGPHAFSEILYAFSSAGNNNGSAFAGLNANTVFYNMALGVAMFIARYYLAVPVLAVAGSLAAKKTLPGGSGTMSTDNWLFVALLIGVVVIFGVLTFVPALALGPIVEHLLMQL